MHAVVSIEVPNRLNKINRVHGLPYEDCCVCDTPTPFWNEGKDVPLCLSCADNTPPHEVPTKRAWLERLGVSLPPGWAPDRL